MAEHVPHHHHRHRRLGHEQHAEQLGHHDAACREERERLAERRRRDDEGEGHGRVAGVELEAQQHGQAEEHHREQRLREHEHDADEQQVRLGRRGQVAHDGQAHGSRVDAEQRTGAFGRFVLHVAVRHHGKQHQVAGESEPEQHVADLLHAEGGGGGGGHDDAHVADEVGGEHFVQLEVRDEADGEPAHERKVGDDGRRPQHERGDVRERGQVPCQLHEGHEEGGAHACHDGVVQVVANHAGEEDDLRREHDDEEERQRAAYDVHDFGVGLQQIAECGKAEGNACGGDGNLFDDLAHGVTFLLPRIILLDARGWEGRRHAPCETRTAAACAYSCMTVCKRKLLYSYVMISLSYRMCRMRCCVPYAQVKCSIRTDVSRETS